MNNEPPKKLWMTILGRANFGFFAETSNHSFFLNDGYLQRLCEVENGLSARYGKLVQTGFVLALFGLATAYGVLGDFAVKGFSLAKVPFLLEFCILAMGVLVMLQVTVFLDILAVSGMRHKLFSMMNTEVPNMRMVHMKGDNAWLDAIAPKFIGYRSGFVHRLIARISFFWSLCLPFAFFSVVIASQAVCFLAVEVADYWALSIAISYVGLGFSGLSIFVLLSTMFLPLPFSIDQQPSSDLADNAFNTVDAGEEHSPTENASPQG